MRHLPIFFLALFSSSALWAQSSAVWTPPTAMPTPATGAEADPGGGSTSAFPGRNCSAGAA